MGKNFFRNELEDFFKPLLRCEKSSQNLTLFEGGYGSINIHVSSLIFPYATVICDLAWNLLLRFNPGFCPNALTLSFENFLGND